MRRVFITILLVLGPAVLNGGPVNAQDLVPEPLTADKFNWISPPAVPGLRFSWIQGNETADGLYVLRVRLASGSRIPPHSHPDQRISTVLSGILYVGFGEVFSQDALVAVKSGDAYVAPANTPHFLWAKEGTVEYQETGLGPTATKIVGRP